MLGFSTLWACGTADAGLAAATSEAWWRCKSVQQLTQLLLQVFEKGNFAGLEEMKCNPRLFDRIAPMGVTDIIMAVSYSHAARPPLAVPITAFDGIQDPTIAPGNVGQWAGHTCAAFKNVPIMGDHYFVASQHRQVCPLNWPVAMQMSWQALPETCDGSAAQQAHGYTVVMVCMRQASTLVA